MNNFSQDKTHKPHYVRPKYSEKDIIHSARFINDYSENYIEVDYYDHDEIMGEISIFASNGHQELQQALNNTNGRV